MLVPRHRKASGWPGAVRLLALLLISGLFSVAALPSITSAQSAPVERQVAKPHAGPIAEASQRFRIPERWIRAVMQVESAGEVRAVSSAGAIGLMQIMPNTWAGLRIRHRLGRDPFDPRDNILGGAAYLREAYNAGPGRYEDHLATGRALPRETRVYMARLMPMLGIEQFDSAVTVTAEPPDWREAPLFVERSRRTPTANSVQDDDAPTDDLSVPARRKDGAQNRQSDRMFIAQSLDEGTRR